MVQKLGLKTFGEELRELSDKYYQDAIGRVGQAQLDRYGKTADTYYQKLLKSFEGTGLTPESVMLYGVNPQDFLGTPSTSAVATQEDLARAKALQSLEGSIAGVGEAGIEDLGVVGSMVDSLTGTERLRSEIAAARDALAQEFRNQEFASYLTDDPIKFLSNLAPYVTGELTGRAWEAPVEKYKNLFQSRLNPIAVKDGGTKRNPRIEALKKLIGK